MILLVKRLCDLAVKLSKLCHMKVFKMCSKQVVVAFKFLHH